MAIKEKIVNECNKIKEMDGKRRKDYLLTYYKWPGIFLLIGLAMLGWFVKDVFFQPEPVSMGCAYGVELTDEQKNELTDGYMEYYGYNPKKCAAVVATDNLFEGTAQQMDANGQEMALFAQIASGQIYYLILDESLLKLYANGGIYSGLEEVLPKEMVDSFGDNVMTLTDPETGEEYKAAVDLKALGFFTEEWQDGYLVFTIARPDDEYPIRLINYLTVCGKR